MLYHIGTYNVNICATDIVRTVVLQMLMATSIGLLAAQWHPFLGRSNKRLLKASCLKLSHKETSPAKLWMIHHTKYRTKIFAFLVAQYLPTSTSSNCDIYLWHNTYVDALISSLQRIFRPSRSEHYVGSAT